MCILCEVGKFGYKLLRIIGLSAFFLITLLPSLLGQVQAVDLGVIAQIESSNNPKAINRADNGGIGSYGLYQLSPYAVEDFNKAHKTAYKAQIHALRPATAHLIADWYIHVRIPQILRSIGKEATRDSVLTCWNMGCGAVRKGRKAEAYIAKYRRLANES